MKKILFLLLFTVSIYGQTLQNPTFGIVTEKNNATDSTPAYFVTSQTDGVHKKTPAALIAFKSDLPASYAVIVYVNATTPNTATIFNLNNPPITNDNLLKNDTANLYIGTDASTWVYNGSIYITKTVSTSSNFKIVGTGVDAGSNKTSSIYREGSISSNAFVSSNAGMFVNRDGSNTAQNGGFFSFSNSAASNSMMFQLNASNGIDLWNYAGSNWSKRFAFSSGGDFISKTYNGYYPVNQDGSVLYHNIKWFTPSSTVSSSGTTVTSIGTQFNSSMIGAKLIINNEQRIITGYTSTTIVTVDYAYDTNYSGVIAGSWGVYSRSFSAFDVGNIRNINYSTDGFKTIYTDVNNTYYVNSEYALFNKLNTNMINLSNNLNLADSSKIIFAAPSENIEVGVKDLGLRRNSAGLLEIYDGTTNGNFRDLKLRNLYAETPTTSAGTYDILTRNISTGVVEKVTSASVATTASPTFTGTPTAPTATAGTNTTQIATTAFVQAAATSNIAQTITNGVTTSAPSQDAVFDALAGKVNSSGGTFTGNVTLGGGSIHTCTGGTGLLGCNGNISFTMNHPSVGWTSNTNIKATFFKTSVYTVATLPTENVSTGSFATVSDATAPTYLGILTGGGVVVCPVFFNGTSWVAH